MIIDPKILNIKVENFENLLGDNLNIIKIK